MVEGTNTLIQRRLERLFNYVANFCKWVVAIYERKNVANLFRSSYGIRVSKIV